MKQLCCAAREQILNLGQSRAHTRTTAFSLSHLLSNWGLVSSLREEHRLSIEGLLWRSLFADRASRARHQIWVLLDVIVMRREHLEVVISGDAVRGGRGGHLAGVEGGDFGLERGDSLLLCDLHGSLGCDR